MSEAALFSMRGIEKRFGAVRALVGVDLEVRRGEVHALIGENGAGKSTLMKVLSGAHRPDAGVMSLAGAPYAPRSPLEARRRGVAMIYQELALAPDLTVEENLVLGAEPARLGFVSRRARAKIVTEVLDVLAHRALTPSRRVSELGPGARQLVEIGRALAASAEVVVLDEPTSSLSASEARVLDAVIGRLRARGVAIVYISHFLEEVQRVADRFTVLRDGATVASGEVRDVSVERMVELMVGRRLEEAFPRAPRSPGEVILSIDRLAGRALPREATLELRAGEILGVAGLVGAGRTELVRAIYGLDPVVRGTVTVRGAAAGRGPRGRVRAGLGMVSEDRKGEGLALDRSIGENLTLSHAAPFSRFGWMDLGRRAAVAAQAIARAGIKSRDATQPVRELSGGNQQKVALARLLHQDADVLLLDEPTRGIDVGSKVEVYRLIGELAAQGKAVLIVSSYLPELLGVCDRICVMHRGVLGAARPRESWTDHALMDAATRGEGA